MLIDSLLPTQEGFRLSAAVRTAMAEHIKGGGRYDRQSINSHSGAQQLIALDRFPDGQCFVRDGLHRVVSIYVGRRSRQLYATEYTLQDRTYAMYLESDVSDGWYTPFDPRSEVRLADFMAFRTEVLKRVRQQADPTAFITANRHLFCRPRRAEDTFAQLAQKWHDAG